MSDAYVLDAVRTPFGRYGGALPACAPTTSAAHVVRERCVAPRRRLRPGRHRRRPASATPTAPARTTATSRAWPCCSPGCRRPSPAPRSTGSAARAWRRRSRRRRAIETGDADVVARRRRRVDEPRAVGAAQARAKGFPRRPTRRCTRPRSAGGWSTRRCPSEWTISLGESTEKLAEHLRDQPRGAGRVRAAQPPARRAGLGRRLLRRLRSSRSPGTELDRDEGIRADTSAGEAGQAQAGVRKDGTVTAGNASPLNDGAAALLLGDDAGADRGGRTPLARIVVAAARTRSTRDVFGIGPVEAANRALARAGIGWDDLDVVELNEAFAAQSLACLRRLAGARPRRSSTPTAARSRSATRSAPRGARDPRHARPRAARAAAAARASPRSASASARAWPWSCMPEERCMSELILPPLPATTDVHPPLDFPGYRVDRAAPPHAAADPAAAAADRGDRAAARRRAWSGRPTTT